jgi:hypothetical protein
VVEQVPRRPRWWGGAAHPHRTQITSQVQIRDPNGAQAAMTDVIADRQPAHRRRTGTGQNGSANRRRRSEFEWMSAGRRAPPDQPGSLPGISNASFGIGGSLGFAWAGTVVAQGAKVGYQSALWICVGIGCVCRGDEPADAETTACVAPHH